MAPASKRQMGETEGFVGAVAGFSLADVIQLNNNNRFSGRITVQYESSVGHIFFRDGDVVHAEQGDKTGFDAFCDIMEWRSGRFDQQANIVTTQRTIQMNSQHLLMDAHRIIDERRAGMASRPVTSPATQTPREETRDGVAGVLRRLAQIPGVDHVLLSGSNGAQLDEGVANADKLAGQAAYIALIANQISGVFQTGPMHSAVVEGSEKHVLVLAAKNQTLSLLLQAESEVSSVESEVRKILAPR